MKINHLLISIVLFVGSNGQSVSFWTNDDGIIECTRCVKDSDCWWLRAISFGSYQCCKTEECAIPECDYEGILKVSTPDCEPRMIQQRQNMDQNLQMLIDFAQYGLSGIAAFGPTQNAAAMMVSVAGNHLLNNALGNDQSTEVDSIALDELYNELISCMDQKVEALGLTVLQGYYAPYLYQIYDIIDDMSKNSTKWSDAMTLVMMLESTVGSSDCFWKDATLYNDELIVKDIAPIFAISLEAVYLTSTTYLGMLYQERDCRGYIEQLSDLKKILQVYLDFISKSYATFNRYYTPLDTYVTNDKYKMYKIVWDEGNEIPKHPSQCRDYSSGNKWWEDIWDQFEEYRAAKIGDVYEWTHEIVDLVNSISNDCTLTDYERLYKNIKNEKNGLCLTADGSDIILSECNSDLETQKFYLLDNELKNTNGKCVAVEELWDLNSPLHVMDCDGGDSQYWLTDLDTDSNGYGRILASNHRCLGQSWTVDDEPSLSVCEMNVETGLFDAHQRWSFYE